MTTYRLPRRQSGVALPVMLIMMLVLLVTSVYLLRSSNSATLTASNLAYDATLSRAVDVGLHAGFYWLKNDARGQLGADNAEAGYRATFDPASTPRDAAFWNGSAQIEDSDGNAIRYVIHRMCSTGGAWDAAGNSCVQSPVNTSPSAGAVADGESLASDAPAYSSLVRIHYMVTARYDGVRGGNVINQMVVLVGA